MGCKGRDSAAAGKSKVVTVVILVEGMTCVSCEKGIKAEVEALEGVSLVKASHVERQARITFDEATVSLQTVVATINKLGYKASPFPLEEKAGAKAH